MPRPKKPCVIQERKGTKKGSKFYILTLNTTSGLPKKVCDQWQRKSFQNFPPELAIHSNPKSGNAADIASRALIAFLKNNGTAAPKGDYVVGDWLRLFTSITDSPKAARNVSENTPYSDHSVDRLKGLYDVHMVGDPFLDLLMSEVELTDAMAFMNRMGLRKLEGGKYRNKKEPPLMRGTETFNKLVKFVRMAFKEYSRDRPYWRNVFLSLDPPKKPKEAIPDALPEVEVLRLFGPGVLNDVMELAVCAAMFLAGLRRSEVFALKPEDLDWHTPKIVVRNAWQNFSYKRRKMGPPKGKKEREAPFDKVLQNAIRELWNINGQHEYVFSYKSGKTPGPSWIKGRFKKWLARAKIELRGRKIVPHSSRHSLASILEERNVPLRHIQELLGHSSMKTTKRYLHSTDSTIRNIGSKIDEALTTTAEPAPVTKPVKLLRVV
jgi:integrase